MKRLKDWMIRSTQNCLGVLYAFCWIFVPTLEPIFQQRFGISLDQKLEALFETLATPRLWKRLIWLALSVSLSISSVIFLREVGPLSDPNWLMFALCYLAGCLALVMSGSVAALELTNPQGFIRLALAALVLSIFQFYTLGLVVVMSSMTL